MDKSKIYLTLGLIASIALILYLICSLASIKKSLDSTNQKLEDSKIQMKQLEDSIVRSQSAFVTSDDLDLALQELGLDSIKKDLKSLGAKIDSLNVVVVTTPGFSGTKIPSTSTKPSGNPPVPLQIPCKDNTCTNPDAYGYLNNEQTLSLNEPFSNVLVPFGSTTFKAWEEKPWSLDVFKRKYLVENVISKDEEGQTIVHNRFKVEVEGKQYPVEIGSSQTLQQNKESEFWFNPKLYLGMNVGASVTPEVRAEVIPNLEVSLFSYGETKKQSTWKFLGLGVGVHTQQPAPALTLTPAGYNVGEPLPLLDNLFVAPSVSVDTNANVVVTGGVQVGL